MEKFSFDYKGYHVIVNFYNIITTYCKSENDFVFFTIDYKEEFEDKDKLIELIESNLDTRIKYKTKYKTRKIYIEKALKALKILKDSCHTKQDTELLNIIEDELKIWNYVENTLCIESIILGVHPDLENKTSLRYHFDAEDITKKEFEWLYKHIKDRFWVRLIDKRV